MVTKTKQSNLASVGSSLLSVEITTVTMIQIPVNISLAIPQQGRDTRNFVSFDGFTGLLSRTSLGVPFLLFNLVASQLRRIKSFITLIFITQTLSKLFLP